MRSQWFGVVGAFGVLLTACASAPRHDAGANEVPMYTNAEWAEMNSDQSLPEISDAVASSDHASSGGATFTGYSGSFGAFDNYGSGIFRSYGGGSAVHGAMAGTSAASSSQAFSGGGFSAGRASVSVPSHAGSGATGGHSSGGHGGR